MPHYYNIYLNSPQLAYNANMKKYYINLIKKNNKIINKKFELYKPQYYYTSYSRIYNPSKIIMPN
jgi:hypothetical protein